MNTILSFLISFCMLFSGAYVAEDPAAPAGMTAVVRDLIITVDDQEFPLNPSASFGVSTENGSALLDFAMPLGDEILFPVQAELDESGVSVLLGESGTAYTFSAELLGTLAELEEMPPEIDDYLASYVDYLATTIEMSRKPVAEQYAAYGPLCDELLNESPSEDCTFEINGEEISGTRYTISLDHADVMELVDLAFSAIDESFADAYIDYLNQTLTMAEVEIPEISSFSDFYDMIGMEVTAEGFVSTDGVRSAGELQVNFSIDESKLAELYGEEFAEGEAPAAPYVFSVPMEFIAYDAENFTLTVPFELEEEGVKMLLVEEISGQDVAVSLNMAVEEIEMDMYLAMEHAEEGGTLTVLNFNVTDGYFDADAQIASESSDGKNSETDVYFGFSDDGGSFTLSFSVDVSDALIENRIAGAKEEILNTEEDLEGCTGLMMAAMALAGDAEALMSDKSIMSIVEAFTVITDSAVYEEGYGDVSDLSFELPEFAWLPEGYELVDTVADTYYDSADLHFGYTGESGDDKPYFVVTVYSMDNSEYETMILGEDGELSPMEGSLITIERQEAWTYARGVVEGYEVHINYYGSDLTNEDIAAFFSGVSQPEEETAPKSIDIAGAGKI